MSISQKKLDRAKTFLSVLFFLLVGGAALSIILVGVLFLAPDSRVAQLLSGASSTGSFDSSFSSVAKAINQLPDSQTLVTADARNNNTNAEIIYNTYNLQTDQAEVTVVLPFPAVGEHINWHLQDIFGLDYGGGLTTQLSSDGQIGITRAIRYATKVNDEFSGYSSPNNCPCTSTVFTFTKTGIQALYESELSIVGAVILPSGKQVVIFEEARRLDQPYAAAPITVKLVSVDTKQVSVLSDTFLKDRSPLNAGVRVSPDGTRLSLAIYQDTIRSIKQINLTNGDITDRPITQSSQRLIIDDLSPVGDRLLAYRTELIGFTAELHNLTNNKIEATDLSEQGNYSTWNSTGRLIGRITSTGAVIWDPTIGKAPQVKYKKNITLESPRIVFWGNDQKIIVNADGKLLIYQPLNNEFKVVRFGAITPNQPSFAWQVQ